MWFVPQQPVEYIWYISAIFLSVLLPIITFPISSLRVLQSTSSVQYHKMPRISVVFDIPYCQLEQVTADFRAAAKIAYNADLAKEFAMLAVAVCHPRSGQ